MTASLISSYIYTFKCNFHFHHVNIFMTKQPIFSAMTHNKNTSADRFCFQDKLFNGLNLKENCKAR